MLGTPSEHRGQSALRLPLAESFPILQRLPIGRMLFVQHTSARVAMRGRVRAQICRLIDHVQARLT